MIEDRTMKVAKEIDDVALLLVKLVVTIKQKQDMSLLVPELVNAINGVDQVDDEVAANRSVAMSTIGYRLGELIDAIITKGPEAPVQA